MAPVSRSETTLNHLVRIAAATMLGREGVLRREIRDARSGGVSIADLRETLLQTYLFAGFPRAINAFRILDEHPGGRAEPARRSTASRDRRRRGERLCRRIYGRDYDAMIARMRRFHPDLAEWILEEGYGKVLSRPRLSPRIRELLVVSMLCAGGLWRQLPSHLRGALAVGASRGEIDRVFGDLSGIVPVGRLRRARRYVRVDLG